MEYDDLLTKVGSFGRFQWLAIAAIALFHFSDSYIFLGFIFIAATPDHWCRPHPEPEISNMTLSDRKGVYLPPLEGIREPSYR